MAKFEITSPDGKRFEVTAPDGASENEILSFAQQQTGVQDDAQSDPVEQADRSWTEAVKDSGKAIMGGIHAGVGDAIGAGIEFYGEKTDSPNAQEFGRDMRTFQQKLGKEYGDSMSERGRALDQKQLFDGVVPNLDGDFLPALGQKALRSLPGMVVTAPVGSGIASGIAKVGGAVIPGVAGKIISGSASPIGGNSIRQAIAQQGVTRALTDRALALAPTSIGYGGAEGALAGLQNSAQIRSEIEQIPFDQLAKTSPLFAKYTDEAGGDMEAARNRLAKEAAEDVAVRTTLSTGGFGILTGGGALGGAARAAKASGGKGALIEGAKGFIRGAKEEALQEFPQSGGEAYITNLAKKKYVDPTINATDGVLSQAMEGMAVGAATGGVFGGSGGIVKGYRNNQNVSGNEPAGAHQAPTAGDVLGTPEPAPTEAEKALYTPKSLTALDRVNEIDAKLAAPDITQAEVEALTTEQRQITATWPKAVGGAQTSFSTETGAHLNGQYALMEAGDLTTSHDENLRPVPTYPAELQPRERERHASEMQVQQIVGRLDPARLGESGDVATGAPIVGADGLVESGNARTIALKRVYQANGQKASDYKQFIKDNASRFGIAPESVDAMQKPVLVRIRQTPVNRAEFARQANASTVARMSPSEQAKSDAMQMDSLDDLNPDEQGDFMSGTSRPFVRRFMAKLPVTEQSGLIDSSGQLSQTGYTRIRNAVLAKAYGDSPVLLRMVESVDDDLRNVSKALLRVAPNIAKAREAIGEGALHDADITPDLMAAVEELSELKKKGVSVEDALAQAGIFGDKLSPESKQILMLLNEAARSPRRIAEFIQSYLDALTAAGNPGQEDIFGGKTTPAKSDLMEVARRAVNGEPTTRSTDAENNGVTQEDRSQPQDAQGNQAGNSRNETAEGNPNNEWVAFPPDSGTLGVPRAEMPQVKSEHRGALTQFLKGRGIESRTLDIPAADLKPTQAEFSRKKAAAWKEVRDGVDRSVLASSDGHVLDGHHQWVAALALNEPVKVIQFDAPIKKLLDEVKQFPSVKRSEGASVDVRREAINQQWNEALADLGAIVRDHANVARVIPEDTPGLMPTLVKLFEVGIAEVGHDMKVLMAHVKNALKNIPEFKSVWNKIDNATYRKAAAQALENHQAAPQGDLFAPMVEKAMAAQGDLFSGQPDAKVGDVGAAQSWEDRRKGNFVPPTLKEIVTADVAKRVGALVEKWKDNLPEATISEGDRAKAEALLKPVIDAAVKDEPWFDVRVREIGKQFIGSQLGPTKKIERAAIKLVEESFNVEEMKDIVRATIVVNSYDDAQSALDAITKKFKVIQINNKTDLKISAPEGAKLKNKGVSPEGYSDVTAFVRLPGGGIAEVQINVPEMLSAKLAAHVLYEGSRVVEDDPARQDEYAELRNGQLDVYQAALASLLGRLASDTERMKYASSELQPLETGAPLSGTSATASSSNRNQLPSGNLTNSSPPNEDMKSQPSGNLSGTFISSTSNANMITKNGADGNEGEAAPVQRGSGEIADEVGEHLAGSRRDKAAALRDAVTRELSDDEIASLPLSKIWPKESIDQIDDPFIAAVAYAARDAIPAKPRSTYKVKAWVVAVKTMRGLAASMIDKGLGRDFIEKYIGEHPSRLLEHFAAKVTLLESIDRANWGRIGKVEEYPDAYTYGKDGSEHIPSPIVRVTVDDKSLRFEAKSVADVLDKVQAALGEAAKPKKMEFDVRGQPGRYFISKNGDTLYRNLKTFDTTKEAFDYRNNHYDELVAAWEAVKESDNVKETDVRGKENRPRTAQDWRKGKDVTPEQFQESFGFRGIEFGSWVSQGTGGKDRQGMLNQAYDALMDLADIVGVPPKAMSLNGSLGLGFGSRGSGKFSAHFEPDMLVINLTKTRGAGSLAHEWFHALDNYFQSQRGKGTDYITNNPENYYVHKRTGQKMPSRAFNKMIEGEHHQDYGSIDQRYRDRAQWELQKGVRPEVGEAFSDLVKALNDSPMARRASLLDKGKSGGYWSRIIERGARAFENYVIHKMMLKGYHNDYLANVIGIEEFQRDSGRYPYLLEEEVAPVAEAFDNLFSTIQTKETDQGVALLSRSRDNAAPSAFAFSERDVRAKVDDIIATLKLGSKVRLSLGDSFSALPEQAQQDAREQGGNERNTKGVAHRDGTIYILWKNHSTLADVEETIFHELHHLGMRKLFGPQFIAKIGTIFDRVGGWNGIKEMADRHGFGKDIDGIRDDLFGNNKPTGKEWTLDLKIAVLTDEALARIAQKAPTLRRAVDEVYGAIRQWLRKNRFADLAKYNDADIAHLLKQARLALQKDGVTSGYTVLSKAVDTKSLEFKQWFGNSKVVDADGNPLRMLHGTTADFSSFKRRIGDVGIHFGTVSQANDRLEYMAARPGHEYMENNQNLMPVYLSIQNPLRLPDLGLWNADNMKFKLRELFPGDGERIGPDYGTKGLSSTKDIREFLQSKGYDGIVYKNTGEVAGAGPFRKAIAAARQKMQSRFGVSKSSFTVEDQQTPEYKEHSKAEAAYSAYREANGEDSYIAFERSQIKSALSNTGEFSNKNPDIRFSLGTGRGMALRDLQAVVDRVSKGFKNFPRVHVFDSPSELSTKIPSQKALRDFIKNSDAWNDVEGATHDGEIYVFASGMADEARAEHVLATHEITHYGLRGAVGKELDAALQHVLLMNAKVRKAAAAMKAERKLASNIEAVEEVLADIPSADLAKLRGWRKVVQVVRNWLNKAGAKKLADRLDAWMKSGLSDQEKADLFVADLVNAARDWVKNGKSGGLSVIDGTRLAEQRLSDDLAEQEKWLAREAKARGYKSIDELAEKDYKVFESLAALWRKKHPVDVALMSRSVYAGKDGILDQTTAGETIDGARLKELRRAAAGLESPRKGISLTVTEDGRAIATGETGTRIPETFIRFARVNGLKFSAQRILHRTIGSVGSHVGDLTVTTGNKGIINPKSEPMPIEYRESGALYFGESGKSIDRTGKTRFSTSKLGDGNTAAPKQTTAQRAEAIINKPAATPRPLDALLEGATKAVGLPKLTSSAYGAAASILDRYTPEQIKAGMVSDYGIPEAVIDQRAIVQGRQKRQLRAAGTLLEKLSTLTRAESRIAYEWMNTDNPQSSDWFMEQLPPESIKTLAEVEKMIDGLSKEAVRLGQLDEEAYKRNRFAYLHRSYAKHTAELTGGETAARKRAIAVLGDQYKGRGMTDAVDMAKIKNGLPEWWNRKTQQGKADKQLKGERFIRLERRASSGEGTAAIPGMSDKSKGRLLEVAYWPAGEAIPARYGAWDQMGTWEVRDTKGNNLIVWRDFTKQERELMGEIDEARYAIAKTLHGMIHDVETGKYLQWLGQKYAKIDGEAIDGKIVEASDRMRDTYKTGEWVKVPDVVVPGTKVKRYGALAGRYLPAPIWNDVRQTVGFRYQPLGETYAAIHRAWKTSKTAMSVGVHTNNVMANFVMADWHDVTAGHILKALRLMTSKDAAADEVLARFGDSGGSIGTWATKELQQEQLRPLLDALEKELGIAGNVTGQVGVMSALQLALKGRFPSAWDALKPSAAGKITVKTARAMIDLYEAEDQVFRLAAWLKAKEEGKTDMQAGKLARKSFLDYRINAPWVQMMRSTAFPFIAFTYRAVPMMLETAANKPWKLMKLGLIAAAVNALGYLFSGGDEDDERKLLPEEKAGRIWGIVPKLIRMPWNDVNGSPVFLDVRRWVPVGDIFDTGQTHSAMPMLPAMVPGGPLALIAEIALNKQQFTSRPITLETDTPTEKAAKMADYLYKSFAPNIILLPNTYSWTAASNAATGRTDAFGREQSMAQATISSMGIKIGSYPKDALQLNAQRAAQAKIMEIDQNITELKREYARRGMDASAFREKVMEQIEKKRKVAGDLQDRMAGQ